MQRLIGTERKANECSYKTASGELISARGALRVQGKKEYWYGVTFQGRKAHVHKTLISANKVHRKGHAAVVDSNGGCIILHNGVLARKIQQYVLNEIVNEPGAVRLCLENGTYIGYTKIQQLVRTQSDQELCSMHAKQQSGSFRHPRWEQVRWRAWVWLTAALLHNRQRRCNFVRNLVLLEGEYLLKTRLWMQALMTKRSGLVAIDGGCLKLDGREDDDDDEDDGGAQNKLLILVAKDVKTGAYAATRLREKGSE